MADLVSDIVNRGIVIENPNEIWCEIRTGYEVKGARLTNFQITVTDHGQASLTFVSQQSTLMRGP